MTLYGNAKRAEVAPDAQIAAIAAAQHGVFSREQATACGFTPMMIRTRLQRGLWRFPYRGVYVFTAAPRTPYQALLAAQLACGPDALVSRFSAAFLWRYPRVVAPSRPQLIVPRSRNVGRSDVAVHRTTTPVLPEDRDVRYGIPVTGAARTIFDLAAVADEDIVERALEDALRRKLVTPVRLRWQLERDLEQRRAGTRLIRRVIRTRLKHARPTESDLALDVQRFLERHDIHAVPEYEIFHAGAFVARVDFAVLDARVAIEADSYLWHSGLKAWARDRTRDTKLKVAGWMPFPITDMDLKDRPEEVATDLLELIAARTTKG